MLALRKKSRVVEQLNARRAESWNSAAENGVMEHEKRTGKMFTLKDIKRLYSIGRLVTFIFIILPSS